MKIILSVISTSLLVLLFSCEKATCEFGEEEQNGIVGKWRLVEELMDPGDGSGIFQAVVSDKEIIFFGDGTFEANGEVCTMTNQSSTNHNGTYDTSLETFSPANCQIMAPMYYNYSVSGNTLILTYPCACGCQQKYKRI